MDSCRSKICSIEVSVHGLPGGCTQVPLPEPRCAIQLPLPHPDHDHAHAALPRYIALRGPNGKYLGYVTDHRCRGFLSFCYDDSSNPYVKQMVVEADSGETHLKCCYNDKFWRKNSPQDDWIVAAANSPNADRSSWASTLFRANFSAGKISLLSLQGNGRGKQLAAWEGNAYNNNLEVGGPFLFLRGEAELRGGELQDVAAYEVVSLVKLPRFVAFKGDNNKYVGCYFGNSYNSLILESSDFGSDLVRNRVEEVGDFEGHVWINWNVSSDSRWVHAKMDHVSNGDMLVQFLPVQVNETSVALRSRYGPREFCRIDIGEHGLPFVRANTRSMDGSSRLKVDESVVLRRVTSIVYHLATAHIYDLQSVVLASASATNNSNIWKPLPLVFFYEDESTQSWTNSVSFSTGITFEFSGRVPLVTGTTVTLSDQTSVTTEWGKILEREVNKTITYTVNAGPGQTVTADLVATSARCNVQFSYIQEDVLTSGETVRYTLQDGLFKGLNYTDLKHVPKSYPEKIKQEKGTTIKSSL